MIVPRLHSDRSTSLPTPSTHERHGRRLVRARRTGVGWGRAIVPLLTLTILVAGCATPEPPQEAVVSSHHLATEAGFEVLAKGGTAADAAVAVAAALSVVEPWFSSALGGGTWALYYDAETREVTSLDGVGPTGSLASVPDYADRVETPGFHQSIVPGAWDGWMLWLERYGTLDLGEVLAPATRIAREGYGVYRTMDFWLSRDANLIAERPAARAIYMPEGTLLRYGDTVVQEDLAATFDAIVAAYEDARGEGRRAAIQAARDYVYRGPIARAIADASEARGGYLTYDDLAGYEARIVPSVSIDYGDGVTVHQNPPASQGLTQLLALNVLKDLDLASFDGPDDPGAVHLQVEALKLAFADRNAFVGDPARVDVPVDALLSDAYADDQRARIQDEEVLRHPIAAGLEVPANGARRASSAPAVDSPPPYRPPPPGVPTSTTTFHVVDRFGNAAAVTTSLGAQFLVVDGTGIHMNNRMRFLALDTDDPNRLTPGYEVRHTSNPYLATRDGRPYVLGGNTGVDTQPQGQTQQFIAVHEFGLSAQAAVERPRFVTSAFAATTYPYAASDALALERGWPDATAVGLADRGHTFTGRAIYGIANMIVQRDGRLQTGADPRQGTTFGDVR